MELDLLTLTIEMVMAHGRLYCEYTFQDKIYKYSLKGKNTLSNMIAKT